uniref:Transmembrane protein 138 n=1 Tax=Parascaris equorum TaxID=6256 RepID=A0A914R2Y8_PAREQ
PLSNRLFIHIIYLFNISRILLFFFSGSALYYFTYKRTALLLSHPKYQHDSEWIREKIRQKP